MQLRSWSFPSPKLHHHIRGIFSGDVLQAMFFESISNGVISSGEFQLWWAMHAVKGMLNFPVLASEKKELRSL
jgi:hypothetical protein